MKLFIQACKFALVAYCLFSNREGLGTSLQIMGLATIDHHMNVVPRSTMNTNGETEN